MSNSVVAEQVGKHTVNGIARLKAWWVTRRLVFMALYSVITAATPPTADIHYLLKLCRYLCL